MRAFIAIWLDDTLKEQVSLFLKKASAITNSVKWTEPDKIHITLKFLGDIQKDKTNILQEKLDEISSLHKSFNLKIKGVGGFPNLKNPRVIWLGIKDVQPLIALNQDIENICSSINIKKQDKEFSPHITIARVKDKIPKALYDFLMDNKDNELGILEVKTIYLMKSILKPQGPEYSIFSGFSLLTEVHL